MVLYIVICSVKLTSASRLGHFRDLCMVKPASMTRIRGRNRYQYSSFNRWVVNCPSNKSWQNFERIAVRTSLSCSLPMCTTIGWLKRLICKNVLLIHRQLSCIFCRCSVSWNMEWMAINRFATSCIWQVLYYYIWFVMELKTDQYSQQGLAVVLYRFRKNVIGFRAGQLR
jgi:hypothetical protein